MHQHSAPVCTNTLCTWISNTQNRSVVKNIRNQIDGSWRYWYMCCHLLFIPNFSPSPHETPECSHPNLFYPNLLISMHLQSTLAPAAHTTMKLYTRWQKIATALPHHMVTLMDSRDLLKHHFSYHLITCLSRCTFSLHLHLVYTEQWPYGLHSHCFFCTYSALVAQSFTPS